MSIDTTENAGLFPHAKSTLPFWRTDLHELDSHRSTRDLPQRCDVLIVGAGYAGAATAYHLFSDNPTPPSTVILEARQACGHLRPDVHLKLPDHISKHGIDAAVEISDFEVSHIEAVDKVINKEKIDCEFRKTHSFDVFLDEDQATEVTHAYGKMVEAGRTSVNEACYTAPDRAEAVCAVKGAKACFVFPAAHLWPYKFVMALLAKAVDQGVNLQTHTPVTSISSKMDMEGYWTVNTDRGIIKARKIVHASNAYTAGVLSSCSDVIVPCRAVCSHITRDKDSKPLPFLNHTYGIFQGPGMYDYLIQRDDGSIVIGGAKSVLANDRRSWYNVSDDSKMMEPADNYFEGYMQRTFFGWEDITATTRDGLPHIGSVPSKPNQYILAGFNGHGMPVFSLAAKGIAAMLRDEKTTFEQTGIPRVFRTTSERLSREFGQDSKI